MSNQKVTLDIRATAPAIEEREGSYYIKQSPISLASVILRFKEGLSPDTIRRDCFPSLPLSSIYSVVSYYLSNQGQVDKYLEQVRKEDDERQQQLLAEHPDFIKTAEELRERISLASRE
jgi:uncharacterized protein (DUF433 family)